MSEIPGSAPTGATPSAPVKPNENLPTWARVGRWAARYGEGVKPPELDIAGSPVCKAVGYKRAWESDRNEVPLAECVRVERLLKRKRAGKAWPFALEKRLAAAAPPSLEQQQRVVGARWNLRGAYLELFCWIILGNVLSVWRDGERLKSRGLHAKQSELGELVGSPLAPALSERRVREILHTLRRWGLIYARHSFKPYGAVTSQREHVYRVTTLAIDTFGLGDVIDRGSAPDPEPGLTPRIARARQTGRKIPATPETTFVKKPAGVQTAHAEPIHSADLAVSSSSISSSEANDVITSEPCGSTKSSTPTDGLRPLSAAPTRFGVAPVPNETTDATHRETNVQISDTVGPLCERGGREASPLVGDVLPNVRRGDVDANRREERERRRQRDELEQDKRRRDQLREQVERRERAERQRREQLGRLDDAPPPAEPPDDTPGLDEARRAELERYKQSLVREQPPLVRRRTPEDDELELLEQLEQTNATRGWKLPPALALRLIELRTRKGGAS